MDSHGRSSSEEDEASSRPGVQETSFMTEGSGESYVTANVDSDEPVKSSRSMPLPDYLRHRSIENLHVENEIPPPSYDAVVSNVDSYAQGQSGERRETVDDDEDELSPEEIAVIMRTHDDDLNRETDRDPRPQQDRRDIEPTPDEAAALRRRQEDRSKYLDRRGSFEEAIEMLPKDDTDAARPSAVRSLPPREIDQMQIDDVEARPQREEFTCAGWGPLDEPMTRFCRFFRRQSSSRLLLFSLLLIAILGLILFVSLFPASFVYIEYHEIALAQSKMTNVVDREHVYYDGCYVLGPDTHLLRFSASVQTVVEEMSVFTRDTIAVGIKYTVHYFIRPAEIGKLYSLFLYDYPEVFELIIRSSLRNLAGTSLTVDNFRFNRTYVETQIHSMLRKRLGGDCCPDCCNIKPPRCQSNTYCSQCRHSNCNQGYHVDVRYFNLLSVDIPNEVFQKLLQRTIMEVNQEKEFFLQDHSIMEKETELLVRNVSNAAEQLIEKGKSDAAKIMMIADGEAEKIKQAAHVQGLNRLFSRLNVSAEDEKLSLMLLRELEDNVENIVATYGFGDRVLYSP